MSPSTVQQPVALPDELLLLTESQWLFTPRELSLTPSIHDGLPAEKERANRAKGVNFILQVGVMLRLPQTTLATASVFLHRFYMRHSMVEGPGKAGYHYYPMAATSLFLATKVEETCRKMKELVIACVRVAQKDPQKPVDEQDREYWRWRDNILLNEDLLLEALCFDLTLESPYTTLFRLLVHFREDQNKRLRNAAWAFVNDSCLTMLCLMVPSKAIAASALFAGAKLCGVRFPDEPSRTERGQNPASGGQPWWHSINVSSSDILTACNHMCDVYENLPPRSSREAGLYERIMDETSGLDVTRSASAEQQNERGYQTDQQIVTNGTDHAPEIEEDRQATPNSPMKRRREDSISQVTTAPLPPSTSTLAASPHNPSQATKMMSNGNPNPHNGITNGSLEPSTSSSSPHPTLTTTNKKQKTDDHPRASSSSSHKDSTALPIPAPSSSSTQDAKASGTIVSTPTQAQAPLTNHDIHATNDNDDNDNDNGSEEGEVSEG